MEQQEYVLVGEHTFECSQGGHQILLDVQYKQTTPGGGDYICSSILHLGSGGYGGPVWKVI